MKNKRIVFFCGTLMQGGAERVISVLSRSFCERGFDVSILYYYDLEVFYDIHPDVKLFCVEKETGSKSKLKNLVWIRNFFKENADIVVSFLASFNILALVANFGLKSKILVADRSDPHIVPRNIVIRKLRDFLYRFADGVVLQTKRNFSYFSKAVQKKSAIIFNPTDIGEFRGVALETQKKKRIVSVGRLISSKNHKMLIEAFSKISNLFPEYTLTIYGEGNAREDLESRVLDLGLSEKVFLPGNEKNIFEKIADAEFFVLPSDYEGMPNALIEAMCLGLPVISTDVSGAGDFIESGKNGLLVECKDLAQLESAMQRFLEEDSFRISCAQNAVLAFEKVKTERISEQWISFIFEL